jgi:hypothetical protein
MLNVMIFTLTPALLSFQPCGTRVITARVQLSEATSCGEASKPRGAVLKNLKSSYLLACVFSSTLFEHCP